ncbi:MAG: methylenetetrahydrofolate reductase [Bacteroidaceae bacterium]
MKITELISQSSHTAFSFEVLPPLKGAGINKLQDDIRSLLEFDPKYINITAHRSEVVMKDLGNGLMERSTLRRRPGSVAVAAALQKEFGVPIVPHILCSGFTREETEYVLIDLQYLGITNLLLLRGDKAREDAFFKPVKDGYSHTIELQKQVNDYNKGLFVDGSPMKEIGPTFSYGVACYPEKHEESPNIATDAYWFNKKVELGAEYGVTQMFFDNQKYFDFVKNMREQGITVPIIPGIKPLAKLNQLNVIPRLFHCDLPEALTKEAFKCKTDDQIKSLGIEWCEYQCRELIKAGVSSIHFYMTGNVESLREVAKRIF